MRTVKSEHAICNFSFISDWHLSAVPPGSRADDYESAILGKIEFVRDLTRKIGGFGLCGGDLFHIKNSRSPANSNHMLSKLLYLLRTFPTGKIYGTVGNHDLGYGERIDSIPGQPLGLLIASGAYWDLSKDPVMFQADRNISAQTCSFLPSVNVQVSGFAYDRAEGTLRQVMAAHRDLDATYHVGIVHAYGAPGGGGSIYGEPTIGYDQVADSDFDYLLWGHDHARIETQRVGKVTHVHLGSLARAALDYDQKERPVTVAVLSFSDSGSVVKEIPVPVKPLEQVFVTADRGVKRVAKSEGIKEFFSKMDEIVGGMELSDPDEALKVLCKDDPKLLALARELCGF